MTDIIKEFFKAVINKHAAYGQTEVSEHLRLNNLEKIIISNDLPVGRAKEVFRIADFQDVPVVFVHNETEDEKQFYNSFGGIGGIMIKSYEELE